jgi:hypothetical protein
MIHVFRESLACFPSCLCRILFDRHPSRLPDELSQLLYFAFISDFPSRLSTCLHAFFKTDAIEPMFVRCDLSSIRFNHFWNGHLWPPFYPTFFTLFR